MQLKTMQLKHPTPHHSLFLLTFLYIFNYFSKRRAGSKQTEINLETRDLCINFINFNIINH